MRGASMWAIGVIAMAVTSMVNVSGSFAADTSRGNATEERIGHGGSTYSSSQPDGVGACARGEEQRTIDTTERIGHGGSTYQSKTTKTGDCQGEQKRVDVVQRVGQGGSTYSFSQTMNN